MRILHFPEPEAKNLNHPSQAPLESFSLPCFGSGPSELHRDDRVIRDRSDLMQADQQFDRVSDLVFLWSIFDSIRWARVAIDPRQDLLPLGDGAVGVSVGDRVGGYGSPVRQRVLARSFRLGRTVSFSTAIARGASRLLLEAMQRSGRRRTRHGELHRPS